MEVEPHLTTLQQASPEQDGSGYKKRLVFNHKREGLICLNLHFQFLFLCCVRPRFLGIC